LFFFTTTFGTMTARSRADKKANKKGAVKKRAIKKTATTLKRVGKQSFLWYNKFDEKIPTRI